MKALIEVIDFYYNEAGLMVFTEKYHLDRGYCCGNGCLHCPYDFASVPEPLRSTLREKRRDAGLKDAGHNDDAGPLNNKD